MKNPIKNYGRKVKMYFYRKKYRLKNVHSTFYMGGKSSIAKDLIAGPYVYIGPNSNIYPKVKIGAYTMLANNVSIIGKDHIYNKPGIPIIFSGRDALVETIIGKDCWVGAHSIIMLGVKIGDGTIVAAGSIVTKDLEPFSIYAGVPVKKIRNRFSTENEKQKHIEMLSINATELPENIKNKCEAIKQ